MTMVRPCRLITRQRSHMGLTDARTFIGAFFAEKPRCSARLNYRETRRSIGFADGMNGSKRRAKLTRPQQRPVEA
jgi:hypothetical protein